MGNRWWSSWTGMDEERRAGYRFVAGCILLMFTVFTLVSTVSYLYTWQADQSLVRGAEGTVRNSGGSLGMRWGHFLVYELCGMAAFLLAGFLVYYTVRLLFHRRVAVLRALLATLSATFIGACLLAFIAPYAGLETVFGGGLGGACGALAVSWTAARVGTAVTAVAIGVLVCLWAFFMSRPFARWITRERVRPAKPARTAAPVEAGDDAAVTLPALGPVPPVPAASTSASAEDGEAGGLEVIKDDTLETEVVEELPRINNRDELPGYRFPSLDLLGDHEGARHEVSKTELERNNGKIRTALGNYKIQVVDVKAVVGPTVTLYKVYPAPGVKISTIRNLHEDIAMSLNARGVRVVNLSDSVGIEVANDSPSVVPLKALLNDPAFRDSGAELPVAIGYSIQQKVKVFDLADAPHLLVAGATKQGKSVGLNVIVSSLLYAKHPSELKFVFIDPKMVEFTAYGKLLHHYLAVLPEAVSEEDEREHAIVKDAKRAAAVLKSLCVEMDARYELLSRAGVNNIKLYNDRYRYRKLRPDHGHRFLPYIVVVVDEYADLTMSVGAGPESKALSRSITTSVIRLAQKGRAAGLHVILATQRPTVDVVTGLIKANFPMRIAFRVTSRIDSSTILDNPGAEMLIGRGDMLLYGGVEMERLQCAYVSNEEIHALTSFVGDQEGYQRSYNTPYYLPEPEPESGSDEGGMVDMKNIDERFEEAARLVVQTQRGSTSDLQRRLGMGYAKAGRVMDQLEAAGIVGPQSGSKPREVLVKDFAELDGLLQHFLSQ